MNYEQTISQYQPLLRSIAYNLVGCKADAEDIVQETFLKWLSVDPSKIENVKAYLIKAVTNNCHNHRNTLRKKKEELFNAENVKEVFNRFKETSFAHLDLEIHLTVALKAVYAKLEPLERIVYLLKEILDFDYDVLQETVNKKKEHCRQLLCRAKKKLQEGSFRFTIELPDKAKLLESFKQASDFGNVKELINELKKDFRAAMENNQPKYLSI